MPTPTQTATPHTTGPLWLILSLRDSWTDSRILTITKTKDQIPGQILLHQQDL